MLTIRDLRVRYGAVEALKGISLDVAPGQIVSLLGANGAGKTTTLMAISGLVPVSGGTIEFEGRPLATWTPEAIVQAGVIQVPEGRRVFPRLTVLENLRLGAYRQSRIAQSKSSFQDLRRAGLNLPEARGCETGSKPALEEIWTLFPVLRDRQGQLAGTLSGGEQQMLALARGLMAAPRLLLLDEPSLGLAPKVVTQLFRTIQRINARGLSILLVEQNAYQALQVAHRGYVLVSGQMALTGPAARLMDDPTIKAAYLGG